MTTMTFLLLIILLAVLVAIYKLRWVIQDINENISRLRSELINFRIGTATRDDKTTARDYNARKRDEKLLREFRKLSKQETGHYGINIDSLADNNIKLDGIAKLCRGIDGVARQCANSDIDFLAFFRKLDKHEKEGMRILNLLEATLEKAKKVKR